LLPWAFPSPGISTAIAVTVEHGDRGQIVPAMARSVWPFKLKRIPGPLCWAGYDLTVTEAPGCGGSAIMAMEFVDQVRAIGMIAPAVHCDYRTVFESGSMEHLMRFLAMGNISHGNITRVSESINIPMNMVRC
jgi:hypothetical protein